MPIDKAWATHHEDLLKHMQKFDFNKLINFDYHSDICEGSAGDHSEPDKLLNGTWANFVSKKNRGHYIWVYPETSCARGRCNSDSDSFCNVDPNRNPFLVKNPRPVCGWKKVSKRKAMLTENELKRVIAVGFAMSPWYSDQIHLQDSQKLMRYFKVKKMRR